MKISTFLSGLLCLTLPARAVARRLEGGMMSTKAKNEKDEYYENLYGDGVVEPDDVTDYDPYSDDGVEGYPFDPIMEVSPSSSPSLSSSPSASPSGVEGNFNDELIADEEKNGSIDYGYVEASMLWNNAISQNDLYTCESITETFWVDVQTSVFPLCDDKWPAGTAWESYSQLCKSGAEQFAMEEMDKCFDVAKCTQVGVSAAAAVAGTFCKQNSLYHKRPSAWIPTKCVDHALVSCKYDAVETVQKFNQGGVCASGSALDYVDELYQLCDQEVSSMEQAANLAGYY
jgi:uncharacterized membrane protein